MANKTKEKDVLRAVKSQIEYLTQTKAANLETIRQKQTEAKEQKAAADLAIAEATEKMDIEAYEEAKQAKRKAQSALDMYTGRYKQLEAQEYISEAESDKVIDSLLQYEKDLAADFKERAAAIIFSLQDLAEEYGAAVKDTEDTLGVWTSSIHANYSTRGLTFRTDPFTGLQTDRAEKPVPVHRYPYTGGEEYKAIKDFLKDSKKYF